MAHSEIDTTRSLLHDLQVIVRGDSIAAAEKDVQTKRKLLSVASELSERLENLGNRLRRSPSPEAVPTARLTALGRATAEVGYRINNLLSVLTARIEVTEVCLDTGDAARAMRNVRIAQEQCRQLQTLAVALIDLSGEREHRFRSDLNELIRGTVHFVRLLGPYENIEFDLSLAADLAPLSLDPARWQQLLLSLFSNAADAVGKRRGEGGRIHVSTGNLPSGKRVELIVEDEGRGIAPDDLPRIFDPGFTTKGTGREGFGLTACRSIVEETGGTIRVESARGKGTKVVLTLPAIE